MEDRWIVNLFWTRSPQALTAVEEAYGSQMLRLAESLLGNRQDAEECVNDAYLGLWNRIPPERPQPLLPYALRVVRNLCLKRYHWNSAAKRNTQFDVAFSEMEECLGSRDGPEREQDLKELTRALEGFLNTLSQKDRILFLGRYWYGASYRELAVRLGISENTGAVRLSRLRKRLRVYLTKKGVLE